MGLVLVHDCGESVIPFARTTSATTEQEMKVPEQELHVRFDRVDKCYENGPLVVDQLNLDVHRGEFLTLLGPSGSGKTTTLMMLAGFETPTAGRILVDGAAVNRVPPHKRNMGMVFQNYALFPHMSVAENLAFPLKVRKFASAEIADRVREALDMVRLPSVGDRTPNQLSGGQQQRIAVARALVFRPKLVLMDEPLGALDKSLREQMQYELRRIHRELGVTLIYVTHDQNEALTMSDRIAVFGNGRIQQLATPKDLYEQPNSVFVAGFIGECNLLAGQAFAASADQCDVTLDSGFKLRATSVGLGSAGSTVLVSIRPERIFVGPAAENLPNRIHAKVLEMIYVGDHLRLRCAVSETTEIAVKVPNNGDADGLAPGSSLSLGFQVEDCRALPHNANAH